MITDGQARRIAAEWQGPDNSALATLATTGRIDRDGTLGEIAAEVEWFVNSNPSRGDLSNAYRDQCITDLEALGEYVRARSLSWAEDRGQDPEDGPMFIDTIIPAVPGWTQMWDDTPVTA